MRIGAIQTGRDRFGMTYEIDLHARSVAGRGHTVNAQRSAVRAQPQTGYGLRQQRRRSAVCRPKCL